LFRRERADHAGFFGAGQWLVCRRSRAIEDLKRKRGASRRPVSSPLPAEITTG
jgi:hypothetical protein